MFFHKLVLCLLVVSRQLRVIRMNKLVLMMLFSLLLGNSLVVNAADFNKGYEALNIGDYETAIAERLPLAEQGYADAQYNLGFMYRNGYGVEKNNKTAVKWYTKAAE